MNPQELLAKLLKSEVLAEAEDALSEFIEANSEEIDWAPVGRENNAGPIGAAADPGRSVVERITNATDAVIEREHAVRNGKPECRSPREAAIAWLNIPKGTLSSLSPAIRQKLADRVTLRLFPGEGKQSRLIEIIDEGIGIRPEDFSRTILSLNESNKIKKPYLAGAYGQGGSSTFAASRLSLIASRRDNTDEVGFTVIKYEDAADEYTKLGRYVYLLYKGSPLTVRGSASSFAVGTTVRHWGYDLSEYPSAIGANSVYGLLNEILFDPVLPLWFDNKVNGWRRVIKGSRNALNGAQDEGDERSTRSDLAHNAPLFSIDLGADLGHIGVEYWVLKPPTAEYKHPTAAFVNPVKPIILTLNGQNHSEQHRSIIKKDADLPYLASRLVVHIDCNGLTMPTKRALFVTNREDVRKGEVFNLLIAEIIRILKSDEELVRLNEEARQQGLRERDEKETKQIRNEVARLLKLQGVNVATIAGGAAGGDGATTTTSGGGKRGPRPKPEPIPFVEPPTFVRLLGDKPYRFFPGQRRYLRVETDAHSRHHNASDSTKSDFNFHAEGGQFTFRGSTDLVGGRMRAVFECAHDAKIGTKGKVKVELRRPGFSTLVAEQEFEVVAPPPEKPATNQLTIPLFKVVPVSGPEDPRWASFDWPDKITDVASSAQMEGDTLMIYYSEKYPKFQQTREALQQRDPALANSYTQRYEIWLVVHSLMLQEQEEKGQTTQEHDLSAQEEWERKERCRFATLSAMFALREVESEEATIIAED